MTQPNTSGAPRQPDTGGEAVDVREAQDALYGPTGLLNQQFGPQICFHTHNFLCPQNRGHIGASCFSQGTLTRHRDLLRLPRDLANYVLCHELLHHKVADCTHSWQLLTGIHLSDWRERECRRAAWTSKERDNGSR